jgi:hypothetical protein
MRRGYCSARNAYASQPPPRAHLCVTRPLGPEMLCARGSLSMSTRLLRWALLTELAFAVPTLEPTIAEAQAEVPDAANLYPGRYAAVCTPGPIFGCVCVIDSSGEALMFTELDRTADHHLKDVADSEYLRMISWLRRTCESLTQPATARSVAAEGTGTASQPRAARWGAIGRGRQPRHASAPRTPPTGP